MANAEMREYWNSDQMAAWVQHQDGFDAMLASFADVVLDAAGPRSGERVVDLGCGSGAVSRAAATAVGPEGKVTGLDISEPMVALARELASGLDQADFVCCDVQTQDLSALAADLVVSRFGVMFFDDPVAAFANVASAVAPGGRLAFVCWRSPVENEWIATPMAAVVPILGMPDLPPPDAPGPFQMADADFVRTTLDAAGWGMVEVVPLDREINPGGARDVDAAVDFLTRDGIGRRLMDGKPEVAQAEARAALREALGPHVRDGEGVVLGAAAWLVTAHL